MRDELQIIDVLERIKAFLLAERPQLAEVWERRIEDFAADHPVRFYKERLLAALSGANARAPSELRELARAVRRHEEQPDEFKREVIGEDRPPFYTRLGKGRGKAAIACLEAFGAFGKDSRKAGRKIGRALRECQRLEDARSFLKQSFPKLKGLDVYRALKAWDYPLVLPDRRRQTLFFRLGALEQVGMTETCFRAMARLGESIHRLTAEPLQALDLLTGVFTCAEPGLPAELARCASRPLCERCPVSAHCEHYKHRGKTPDEPRRPTIKDWDVDQRPRERLMRLGSGQLSDAELMAILLRTGSAKSNALDVSQQILKRFGGLKGLDEAAMAELCGEKGIGSVKASTLKAALELGKRMVRDIDDPGLDVQSSFSIYRHFQHRFTNIKKEQFFLVSLNTKHQITHETMVSEGSLASSLVHPREAFKEAIRNSAAAVIFVHNHPSGDPSPSKKDEEVTRRLRHAGRILGIPLLDHVIIGSNRYYSFQDERTTDFSDGEEQDGENQDGEDRDGADEDGEDFDGRDEVFEPS